MYSRCVPAGLAGFAVLTKICWFLTRLPSSHYHCNTRENLIPPQVASSGHYDVCGYATQPNSMRLRTSEGRCPPATGLQLCHAVRSEVSESGATRCLAAQRFRTYQTCKYVHTTVPPACFAAGCCTNVLAGATEDCLLRVCVYCCRTQLTVQYDVE